MTLVFRGTNARLIREHNKTMSLAWYTARMTAYPPAKLSEFVKLGTLMYRDPGEPANQQSADQQLALARSWVSRKR